MEGKLTCLQGFPVVGHGGGGGGKLTCLEGLPGGETLSRKHGLQILRPDPLILKQKQGFVSTLPTVAIHHSSRISRFYLLLFYR